MDTSSAEQTSSIGDQAGSVKDRVKAKAKLGYEKVKDAGSKSVDWTSHEIENRPFASVGVALGVGVLFGVVLARVARRCWS